MTTLMTELLYPVHELYTFAHCFSTRLGMGTLNVDLYLWAEDKGNNGLQSCVFCSSPVRTSH